MEETQIANPVVKEKAPKVLLEILVYGVEEDKPKIKKLFDNIQGQLNKNPKFSKKARVLWYIDKGEKTVEEKKQWLLENCNCIFNVFANDSYTAKPDFVKECLARVKKLQDAIKGVKSMDIVISKNKSTGEISTEIKTEEKPTLKAV